MIKEGERKKLEHWGWYRAEKVVQLAKPVACYSDEKGKALFNPILVQIEWEKPPSGDKYEFWFRYWITFEGEEKNGRNAPITPYSPIMNESSLLELLQKAIRRGSFSDNFLRQLRNAITDKLNLK
jgi:hypothetical protein